MLDTTPITNTIAKLITAGVTEGELVARVVRQFPPSCRRLCRWPRLPPNGRPRDGIDMAAICEDCGMDTTPCTGKRGCRHRGRWEYYMVHDALWRKAKMRSGFLCIGCLERRLGRMLT